jgi:hypothetical protein
MSGMPVGYDGISKAGITCGGSEPNILEANNSSTTFSPFPRFPTEIRRKIWEFAIRTALVHTLLWDTYDRKLRKSEQRRLAKDACKESRQEYLIIREKYPIDLILCYVGPRVPENFCRDRILY